MVIRERMFPFGPLDPTAPSKILTIITGEIDTIDITADGFKSYRAETAPAVLDLFNNTINIPSITVAGEELSLGMKMRITHFEWPITLEITQFD